MATVVPDDGSEGAGAERRATLFRAYLCEECELSVQIYARIVRNVHNIHLSSVLERSGATRKILCQNVTSVKIRHTILHVGPDIRNVFRKPAHVQSCIGGFPKLPHNQHHAGSHSKSRAGLSSQAKKTRTVDSMFLYQNTCTVLAHLYVPGHIGESCCFG